MSKKSKKSLNNQQSSVNPLSLSDKPEKTETKQMVMEKKDLLILLAIIMVSLLLRLYGLSIPDKYNFDEVHYVPAAQSYLEPDTLDPNDIHPPLAKIIMAGFIKVFGDKATGWRIGSVVFGVIMIVLMYYFGIAMFNNRFAAVICASMLSVEFLHLVMSRIATLDIYLACFILLGYYFTWLYISRPEGEEEDGTPRHSLKYLIISGIAFGMGLSVKLSALGGAFGAFLFILIALKMERKPNLIKKLALIAVVMGVSMLGVYLVSHIPFFLKKGEPKKLLYFRTFKFHYTEKFTHPYLSQMWQWPVMHRPIWFLWDKNEETQIIRGIIAMGNLLFWWSFLPVLFDMIYRAFKEKDLKIIFILCGYLPLYLFWLSSASNFGGKWHLKGGFFYYMLPCVPFMAMGLTETLNDLKESRIGRISIIVYLTGLLVFFIAFYPILTGMPINQSYFNQLMRLNIFNSWL